MFSDFESRIIAKLGTANNHVRQAIELLEKGNSNLMVITHINASQKIFEEIKVGIAKQSSEDCAEHVLNGQSAEQRMENLRDLLKIYDFLAY